MRGIRGHLMSLITDADEGRGGRQMGSTYPSRSLNGNGKVCLSDGAKFTGHSVPHTYLYSLLDKVGVSPA